MIHKHVLATRAVPEAEGGIKHAIVEGHVECVRQSRAVKKAAEPQMATQFTLSFSMLEAHEAQQFAILWSKHPYLEPLSSNTPSCQTQTIKGDPGIAKLACQPLHSCIPPN